MINPEERYWIPPPEIQSLLGRDIITPLELKGVIMDCFSHLIKDRNMAEHMFKKQMKDIGASLEDPTRRDMEKLIQVFEKIALSLSDAIAVKRSIVALRPYVHRCVDNIEPVRLEIKNENSIRYAKYSALNFAKSLRFTNVDINKIVTATSELTRNVVMYAKEGKLSIDMEVNEKGRGLAIKVEDKGQGINDLDAILSGKYKSSRGLGMGILGTKRIMDDFNVDTGPSGTTIRISKYLRD